MAITQREAPTTITALDHVFAATADTAVTSIHLCNLTAEDAVIDVYVLPDDGSTTVPTENNKIYNSLTIQGKDTYIIDTEKMILTNGDKIYVQNADSTGQVIATVSTIGL
jgi:putative heme iron utilization protein